MDKFVTERLKEETNGPAVGDTTAKKTTTTTKNWPTKV